MNASPAPARRYAALTLGLVLLGLILLYAGRFVQLDDTSGDGSDRWVVPLGLLASLLAAAAVGVALADRTARRALGAALAVLEVVLVVLAVTDDGFRFVWGRGEEELTLFLVGLGLVALGCLLPRAAAYATALSVGVLVALFVGEAVGTARCACEDGAFEGLVWAYAALALGVVLIVVVEVVRVRRRRAVRRASP